MSKIDEDIGARLTAVRQARGISRKEVHDRLGDGFSVPAVQGHENGRNALRPSVLLRYMELYNIDCVWLLTGEGAPDGAEATARRILATLSEEDCRSWLDVGLRLSGQTR